jgi:hypothetical protein
MANNRFRIIRGLLVSGGGGGAIAYDTSVGNGVTAGRADLPLRAGGTDGTDAAIATPTAGGPNFSTATYGSDRKVTSTGIGGQTIAKWLSSLTVGHVYHVVINYNITSFGNLLLRDNSGNTQATLFANGGGTSNNTGLVDLVFTATSVDMVLFSSVDLFTGFVQVIKVADYTGSLGARRFFVNSTTGDDTRTGTQAQSASTPVATLAKALSYCENGRADQILVAEGMNYPAAFPNIASYNQGFSAVYPFVVQTYDPADASNEAKYGKPAAGNRPKINTGRTEQQNVLGAGCIYIAVRGLDFDPGSPLSDAIWTWTSSTNPLSYILIENNIFRSVMVIADGSAATQGNHYIFRGNSVYGQYSDGVAHPGARQSGLYVDNIINFTYEDNVFWHNGWKVGASRDDEVINGGFRPTGGGGGGSLGIFVHPTYSQGNTSGTSRRNLIVDGGSDGGHFVGPVTFTQNVIIDCPIAIGLGGNAYQTYRPSGSDLQISYNAVLGDADIDSATLRGIGVDCTNGIPGSTCNNNLIAQSRNPLLADLTYIALHTNAAFSLDSYMNFNDNVIYKWRPAGFNTSTSATAPAQCFVNYNRNQWPDAASGTNTNNDVNSYPNPYTVDTLMVALGYSGASAAARKQAMINDAIEHPENFIQRNMRNVLFAGYGMTP